MTPHPLLPGETEMAALRVVLHRTAADLRRVSRSLREAPQRDRCGFEPRPALRLVRGGLWRPTR